MPSFDETSHAFLSACFYRLLKEGGYHDAVRVFRFAVRLYAQERGLRMAQRALRDGRPLDFASYLHYCEWSYTPPIAAAYEGCSSDWEEGDDLCSRVEACPWGDCYLRLGLADGVQDYCADLDTSIARGFNPELRYEMRQQVQDGRALCLHRRCGAAALPSLGAPDPADQLDFGYHCAHLYHAFCGVLASVYGQQEGAALCNKVLALYAERYGQPAVDTLLRLQDQDFSFLPQI